MYSWPNKMSNFPNENIKKVERQYRTFFILWRLGKPIATLRVVDIFTGRLYVVNFNKPIYIIHLYKPY